MSFLLLFLSCLDPIVDQDLGVSYEDSGANHRYRAPGSPSPVGHLLRFETSGSTLSVRTNTPSFQRSLFTFFFPFTKVGEETGPTGTHTRCHRLTSPRWVYWDQTQVVVVFLGPCLSRVVVGRRSVFLAKINPATVAVECFYLPFFSGYLDLRRLIFFFP